MTKRPLTKADLSNAGMAVNDLAAALGVHRTTLSDMLNGKTSRPTSGAHALVWLWARLDPALREALIRGEQFL